MLPIPLQKVIVVCIVYIILKGIKDMIETIIFIYKEYKEEIFAWAMNNALIDLGLILGSMLLVI